MTHQPACTAKNSSSHCIQHALFLMDTLSLYMVIHTDGKNNKLKSSKNARKKYDQDLTIHTCVMHQWEHQHL